MTERETRRKCKKVAELFVKSKHAVVFTGAGISAECGIPTFRGKNGLWTRYNPEEVASIEGFMKNPEAFWNFAKELLVKSKAKPGVAHHVIADLERVGIVKAVITQNIDMLHQKAGSKNVLELHGSLKYVDCLKCGETYEWEVIAKMLESDEPVRCSCGSNYLKPRVVFFGESLPENTLRKAMEESEKSDLFVVVGSSLQVYPAASLPFIAKKRGAKLVIVNVDRTDVDDLFDLVIHEKAGKVLPIILDYIKNSEVV